MYFCLNFVPAASVFHILFEVSVGGFVVLFDLVCIGLVNCHGGVNAVFHVPHLTVPGFRVGAE